MIPPRTILAAIDFSEASTTALVFAARLARHCEAKLHVLHAEHPLLSTAAEQSGIDLAAQTREEVLRTIAATPPAADCAPQVHAVTGPAVDVILEVAGAQRADVVVVGSRGMSGTEKLVFGSITEGLLRRSDVSVLVVPPDWRPPRPGGMDLAGTRPVIAAVDLTESSLAAGRAACRLASTLATVVEIVYVVPDLPVLARWKPHAATALLERMTEARKELENAVRSLACVSSHESRVETGAVADRLAAIARRAADRAPLLVLGKKAPHSGGGAPGTIAYRVLSIADVPVLMYVD
jgi:nucleotide-binding universal stress UspA family protein